MDKMMYYNECALRAEIARNRLTIEDTAAKIGISKRTFFNKLRKGTWLIDEVYALADTLNLDAQRFGEVFFYPKSHI